MAEFDSWNGKLILEVGCGIGTDLRQFALNGAHVVGIDLTPNGIAMAKRGFELFGLKGNFVVADAEALPFSSDSFDMVYSNGVIHHTPDTAATVREIHRVVRPGGQARVMVYHRSSYFAKVIVGMIVAPTLRVLSFVYPGGRLPAVLRHVIPQGLCNMYDIVVKKGYSHETVFSRSQVKDLFASFASIKTFVRQLYYADFLPKWLHRWIERRYGWFLFIQATK
jgi:ubiquinone/menaquinone biosynthesis C-methylase UbiE